MAEICKFERQFSLLIQSNSNKNRRFMIQLTPSLSSRHCVCQPTAKRISVLVLPSVSLKADKRNSSLTQAKPATFPATVKHAATFLQITICIHLDACATTEHFTKILKRSHHEKPVKSVVHAMQRSGMLRIFFTS